MKNEIKKNFDKAENKMEFLNDLREFLHSLSPLKKNPVGLIRWVPLDKLKANNYNPNSVAKNELKLLYTSISEDGYTQPIVTIYDKEVDKYIIVDGFHRYLVSKVHKGLYDDNLGLLPITVINKSINQRMASTIRHNRARGKHSIDGMSNIVFKMLDNGWTDERVCNELGMEADELMRLKHITGFSKLFEDIEYKKAWKTKRQLEIERDVKNGKIPKRI